MFTEETEHGQCSFLLYKASRSTGRQCGVRPRYSRTPTIFHHLRRNEEPMYVQGKGFCHFSSSNVGNSMKRQAIINLIHIIQIFLDGVDDQSNKVAIFVEQQCHCKITLRTKVVSILSNKTTTCCPNVQSVSRYTWCWQSS
jgi:hypothetical protein